MIKKVLMLNVGDIFTIPNDADVYMLIPNTYIDMSDCDKVAVNIQSENGYLGKLRFLENYEEVNVLNTKIEINPFVNIV